MDDLQHHFIKHLLHHQGSADELVDKVTRSAGSDSQRHRQTMLEWIENLVKAGHLSKDTNGITAEEASRLQFEQMMVERRWDIAAVRDPRMWELFPYNRQ